MAIVFVREARATRASAAARPGMLVAPPQERIRLDDAVVKGDLGHDVAAPIAR
jgi:hypothetical protein